MYIKNIFFFALPLIITAMITGQPNQEDYWTESYIKATQQYWGAFESLSGSGSSKEQTKIIRQLLPALIKKYSITSILDIPCGDFNWMSTIALEPCDYIGGDIIAPLIERNNAQYSSGYRKFLHVDATKDFLPHVDLILCRDLLVHLSIHDVTLILKNFKKSGAKYLLTTTFTRMRPDTNSDIMSGGWRTINLQQAPFFFPSPLFIINEQCSEQGGAYNDKSLALWLISDLNV